MSVRDALLRPTLLYQRASGHSPRAAQRIEYAPVNAEHALHNRCGRMIRHDDGVGNQQITDYGLAGQSLQEQRRWLRTSDLPDWPEHQADRDALLEPGQVATTVSVISPLGDVISQTDASGNQRLLNYTMSGLLNGISLRLRNGPLQCLLETTHYTASGLIEMQRMGNGLCCSNYYDPANGRLHQLRTSRHGRSPVQHLVYAYDPLGNITRITDLAQPTRYFANQRVDAVNDYAYDSLAQLIRATGRESADACIGPGLPGLMPDPERLLNYTQCYQYDRAGNLLELCHQGERNYSRRMQTAQFSNHALPEHPNQPAPGLGSGFDDNGNLLQLAPGQPLHWDADNQLDGVKLVSRQTGEDDHEYYRYDSAGERLRKVSMMHARTHDVRREVFYLPGLEQRSNSSSGERLDVISVQAGLCVVRCLHWHAEKPSGVANDQLHYDLADHLGSNVVTLDGQGNLLGHEGYYPHGGTAWRAARSELEVSYRTVRYAGKERDASGLYYYGQRYYAPWLQRWISADPAGDVDGLNLYLMVGNRLITYEDLWGLQGSPARRNRSPSPATIPTPTGPLVLPVAQIQAFNRGVHRVATSAWNSLRPSHTTRPGPDSSSRRRNSDRSTGSLPSPAGPPQPGTLKRKSLGTDTPGTGPKRPSLGHSSSTQRVPAMPSAPSAPPGPAPLYHYTGSKSGSAILADRAINTSFKNIDGSTGTQQRIYLTDLEPDSGRLTEISERIFGRNRHGTQLAKMQYVFKLDVAGMAVQQSSDNPRIFYIEGNHALMFGRNRLLGYAPIKQNTPIEWQQPRAPTAMRRLPNMVRASAMR
ncbi:RHS repeat domain-containing protein [Pseudomonas putida]|uniref:RHS repeat domain-containing protein n=1 Tax=Pseudomonas putida TaxID=303 RepID=UPI002366A2F0|nr:RHS repeat-associated core domain-containing protein [Pseudomonas putida]MDD2046169.1 hypothetical protein [Pseudomonas putida]